MSRLPVLFAILQSGASANGGIASISNVMESLKDHRPIIITNIESEQSGSWRRAGIETHIVSEGASMGIRRRPISYAAAYVRYHSATRKLLKDSGAKIVHANDPLAFQLVLSAVKLTPDVRILLNLRDTLDPERVPPRTRYRMLFGAADHILYLSEDMAARWEQVASNARRSFSVTHSIVDLEKFGATPLPGDPRPIVLLSGIISAKKGQLEFIHNVAPALVRRGIRIWIAGDFEPAADAYAAACLKAARPLGESIRFLGYCNDLPALIAKATVVAVASRHEGLVRSMIEAMSCGRPVVSFSVCSAREMLQLCSGGAGVVVEHGDYAGMTEAILSYCFNRDEAARAGRAGAAAARRLFEKDVVVGRYEDAYRAVAEG